MNVRKTDDFLADIEISGGQRMIDPMVSLAFSIYSNRGVYALLLGSGISRASEIPTGWEVVLDLIRKIAKLEGADCEADPAAWFKQKHNEEPDYSKLLDVIAKTSTERQQLLRAYFEPTEDESTNGVKTPNRAHKAIARLVATGYVRLIVTTNFDRLLERALEEAGVTPTVISTPDQIAGAVPLVHSGATIVKLHGDYLDTRIRNIESELATYDVAFDRLLDRVFDEYGIIICGWSGDWDIALRAALERCPSRRFTTFWATRSPLCGKAKRLAEHRRSEIILIQDANQFFEALSEKVRTLEDISTPHPLPAKLTVATVKRYLTDPTSKIRLHDLIYEETEKLVGGLNAQAFPGQTSLSPAEEVNKRVAKYNALSEILLSVLIPGCYWGNQEQHSLWINCLQRVGTQARSISGLTYLNRLRRNPPLLLLYAAGLAAVAAQNYLTLAAILLRPKIKNDESQDKEFCLEIHANFDGEIDVGKLLPGVGQSSTPVSEYLCDQLRQPLREYIPDDDQYQMVFDRFEYLLALVHADLRKLILRDGWWGPVGRFRWRGRLYGGARIMSVISSEIETQGEAWAPLRAGLFNGSLEQAKTAKARFDAFLAQVSF